MKKIPESPAVRNVVLETEEDIAAFEQWMEDTGRSWSGPLHYAPNPVAVRRLFPPEETGMQVRSRKEMLGKLREIRRRLARDYRDTLQRRTLLQQHDMLQWAMGATPVEIVAQKFLGGVLNVDL